jgi:hypothetical protein
MATGLATSVEIQGLRRNSQYRRRRAFSHAERHWRVLTIGAGPGNAHSANVSGRRAARYAADDSSQRGFAAPAIPRDGSLRQQILLVAAAGDQASRRFLEFFAARIGNKNTRAAYYRATRQFFAWLEQHGIDELVGIEPLHARPISNNSSTPWPSRP